jgi:hypothetical protein
VSSKGRANRAAAMKVREFAARLMRNATDKTLVFGPVLDARFVVCGCDEGGPWIHVIHGDEKVQTEVLWEIMQHAHEFLVEVHADQLECAEACFKLWPCDRTERIVDSVRAGRATRH